MQDLTVDLSGPVHYVDWGGEGPPFLLVHGLGGSLLNWMTVAPALSRAGRTVALDLPGFGSSATAGRSVSIEAQVGTVNRFIERVVGGPCTLIGNSMGGLISATLAATHPEVVAGLVLVDPVLPRTPGVRLDRVVGLSFAAYLMPGLGPLLVRSRRRLSPRRYLDETLALCGVDSARLPPEVRDAMIEGVRCRRTTDWADRAFLDAARAIARAGLLPARLTGRFERITCPTLLIHGALDRLVPVGFARAIAARCPAWEVELLEGVGHVPQLQVPERFVELVLGWRARHAATSTSAA
jgi:pimeloyl-ACP methyl ester carboxylesterase